MNDTLDWLTIDNEGEIFEVSSQNPGSTTIHPLESATLVPPPPLQQQQPQPSSAPAKDHPYFETLKGRTGFNKAKKLEVLKRLVNDQLVTSFLLSDKNSYELLVNQIKSMKMSTGMEDITRTMCKVIEKLESKSEKDIEQAPAGVILFEKFVDKDVKDAYTTFIGTQRQKARRGPGKKIGSQPQGMQLVQEAAEYRFENMMEGGIDAAMDCLSKRSCPGCNHSFLIVHGKNQQEIINENAAK